ncbi:adrenomedullin/calcitonin family protein [Natronobiforma cellulositropha]|nr:adrenomedullin/calcitonin family protein [Natronobiforma cellulositropha]
MSAHHTHQSADDAVEQPCAIGLAHLTVVPTNFDPDAPGRRRD